MKLVGKTWNLEFEEYELRDLEEEIFDLKIHPGHPEIEEASPLLAYLRKLIQQRNNIE